MAQVETEEGEVFDVVEDPPEGDIPCHKEGVQDDGLPTVDPGFPVDPEGGNDA